MSGLKDFYTLVSVEENSPQTYTARVLLNAAHPIFSGHFPGQPVTPGVCTMQIGKEILEKISGKKLIMAKAENVKFLAAISPVLNPEITVMLEVKEDGGLLRVKNTTSFGGQIAMKLSAIFKKQV